MVYGFIGTFTVLQQGDDQKQVLLGVNLAPSNQKLCIRPCHTVTYLSGRNVSQPVN